MPIATINISIPDTMKADVEKIIATEGYGNTSEFFRDLVRDYLRQRGERKLEALLLDGIKSGEAAPLSKADFKAIKERGLKRLKANANR
ncbi:MAG: type II toxin-antitoxin system ParD family antitoxin [Pyrinomonadaceae bacterium]